jgi:hypothetical protein
LHRTVECGIDLPHVKFKDLSLQHRQSVIAEKELCARCLRHSDLDESKKRDCIRKATPPHWLSSSVRRPGRSPSRPGERAAAAGGGEGGQVNLRLPH